MQTRHPYRWLNVIGLVAVVAVNALANLLPINGLTTGELSAKYPVLVTPAGYAFSIWSLIYALLAGFVIYQARSRSIERSTIQRIGPWFILSCAFNIGWILVWHYEYVYASVAVMLALLLSLIALYVKTHTATDRPTVGESLLVQLPFSIYLGWISVATIVNISVAFYKSGWEGFGLSDATWSVIVLTLGTILAFVIGGLYTDPYYVLVFVWAYIAIAYKQQSYESVMTSALIAAGLLLAYAIALWIRKFKHVKD
ncbi:tryptophan-rich sensory protein [Paenibacillus xanthanilyticus]|uniref:Tryptophan-rich sensory protein n=1 Tax=Paenibacillus xanthanilyticus TaxID=1783531 RepID=A0ABV8K8H9_9BACL